RSEFSCGFQKRTGEAYASPPREFYKTLQIYCGGEPARESGVTVSIHAGCDGLIAGKPVSLPHLNLVVPTATFQLRPNSRQIRNTCRRSSTNWSPGITPASFCKACRCAAER